MQLVEDFIRVLKSPKKCITYELSPKKNTSISAILDNVVKHRLDSLVNGYICTDSPLAKMRHSSILACIKFQKLLKKPLICTISLRDKNSLALSSEIIGLNEFDIRMFLALSGDPLKLGDQHSAKGVFEGDSNKIIEIIKKINAGVDFSNNKIHGEIKPVYPFSVINAYCKNPQILRKKLEKKIISGAEAIFTQPLFDIQSSQMLQQWVLEINYKYAKECVLVQGFFPVLRFKSAQFLRDKLPGVFIPNKWLQRLEEASKKGLEFEKEVGMELSLGLYKELIDFNPKIHFMNNNDAQNALEFLNP